VEGPRKKTKDETLFWLKDGAAAIDDDWCRVRNGPSSDFLGGAESRGSQIACKKPRQIIYKAKPPLSF
jgi:hypothetical protein